MNRRSFLVALALAVPLAGVALAQTVATWRPVRLSPWNVRAPFERASLVANARYVSDGDLVLDLRTGRKRAAPVSVKDGAWTFDWSAGRAQARQLILNNGDKAVAFAVPARLTDPVNWWIVRVSPDRNCLEATVRQESKQQPFVYALAFVRWNLRSRQLEQLMMAPEIYPGYNALSRDGEHLISFVDSRKIVRVSTRTGKAVQILPLQGFDAPASNGLLPRTEFSPFGTYFAHALMPQMPGQLWRRAPPTSPPTPTPTPTPASAMYQWRVVDTSTARVKWSYELASREARAVFSRDETLLAVPASVRGVWEIRELRTGQLIRTLPLLPGVQTGAFSPDNATLYCVANGVLYRQRAR